MSTPKRHHYIPRMLLKRFADEEGFLYAFDKRHPQQGIRKSKPVNLFVEKHLYTQFEADGSKDTSVETDFLSPIEREASPVLKRLVCDARRGIPLCLSQEEKKVWLRFFYSQYIRVPENREKLSEEVFQDVISEINVLGQLGFFSDDELSILEDKKTMDRIRRNASIRSVTTTSEEAFEELSKKRICAAVIRNLKPKRSFVIGSSPVLKLTHPGRSHLSDPTVEVWLALDRDVAVSPCPGEIDRVISIRDRHVESINRSILKQSEVIAGCSRELIESLVRSAGG